MLHKMKVAPRSFEVDADGDLGDVHPKRYTAARLAYRFEGEDLPLGKLRKAISLSQERYCGVMATLRDVMPIDAQLIVNGEDVGLTATALAS